jgi:hypothetical protein
MATPVLPPLRPGDINYRMAQEDDQHRFRGMAGAQRWYEEIGGMCLCGCRRPVHADELEQPWANLTPAMRAADMLRQGRKQCPCRQCGHWLIGPLQEGEERRWFGCVRWIPLDESACFRCPSPTSRHSGKRTRLAA